MGEYPFCSYGMFDIYNVYFIGDENVFLAGKLLIIYEQLWKYMGGTCNLRIQMLLEIVG